MKRFNVILFTDNELVMSNVNEIDDVINLCERGDNFIICWQETNKSRYYNKSKVVLGSDLLPKIKNGDIILSSNEVIE